MHWPPAAAGGVIQGGAAPGAGTPEVLLDFTRRLISLRRDHPVFRRRRYLRGRPVRGTGDQLGGVAWFTPGGEEMTEQDWDASSAQSLTVFLNGGAITEADRRGQPIRDDSFLLLFNASPRELEFTLPRPGTGRCGRRCWTPPGLSSGPRTAPWSRRAA